MSALLGDAGSRIADVLRDADAASTAIIEQARSEARKHNENAIREAQRLARKRIERLDRITAEVNAQADALQRHAAELTDAMRRSNDALLDELGVSAATGAATSGDGAKKSLEPTTPAPDEEDESSPPARAPVALRELFGFKRKRFTDKPSPNQPANARDGQVLVASSGEEADR